MRNLLLALLLCVSFAAQATLTDGIKNARVWEVTHSALNANGTNSTSTMDIANYALVGCQVLHTVHDDTSTYGFYASNDGTNWTAISGATATTSGVSGNTAISVANLAWRYIRITVTDADANALARLTAKCVAKAR